MREILKSSGSINTVQGRILQRKRPMEGRDEVLCSRSMSSQRLRCSGRKKQPNQDTKGQYCSHSFDSGARLRWDKIIYPFKFESTFVHSSSHRTDRQTDRQKHKQSEPQRTGACTLMVLEFVCVCMCVGASRTNTCELLPESFGTHNTHINENKAHKQGSTSPVSVDVLYQCQPRLSAAGVNATTRHALQYIHHKQPLHTGCSGRYVHERSTADKNAFKTCTRITYTRIHSAHAIISV